VGIYPSHGDEDKMGGWHPLGDNRRLPVKLCHDSQVGNITAAGSNPMGKIDGYCRRRESKHAEDKNGGESHTNLPKEVCQLLRSRVWSGFGQALAVQSLCCSG
jgi:hypothetical protein